jgi:type IX secretion system PorP/SprF family membrane protein
MKMVKQRLLNIFWMLMQLPIVAEAQTDPHFSQYYLFSHFINPAFTGSGNTDVQIAGIYRNQWKNITNPYTTSGLTADISPGKNIQLGLNILQQQAGNAGFKYTSAYLSVAYTGVRWGTENSQQLSLALQAGMISRRFDPAKLQLDDQWIPGIGYNPGLPSTDLFPVTSLNVEDFGAGILYQDGSTTHTIKPYAGIAVFHLNRPQDPFLTDEDLPYIPKRYSIHGGLKISITPFISWIPHALYIKQGTASTLVGSSYFEFMANESTALLTGIQLRFGDSFIPFAGIRFGDWTLGCSYDVGISSLSRFSGRANSMEISFSYRKQKTNSNFSFECPRF